MLKILLISVSCMMMFGAFSYWNGSSAKNAPRPVENVDLNRYVSTWYEVARKPNKFQTDCWGDVVVNYTLREDGKIGVLNECRKDTADGRTRSAKGKARVIDKKTNSRLQVNFAPGFLDFLPFVWGDYWILELGADYEYAVVGDPERKYLWILSRKPEISEELYQDLLKRIDGQGYDSSEIVKTEFTEKTK